MNRRLVAVAAILLVLGAWPGVGQGEELLDRVLARVNGTSITLSDARAALGVGLVTVPPEGDPLATAMRTLVDRHLMLVEVARVPPAEPDPEVLAREVAGLRAAAGTPAEVEALKRSTGLTDVRIRELARETLRIQAYLDQRFGVNVYVTQDEVAAYYRSHPEEFGSADDLLPFAEAEPAARRGASAARRSRLIDQWVRDLRGRADIQP